jgi:hypothetical protein
MPMNLTPLVFKNGILIGWGNGYYNMLKSRELEAERAKLLPPPAAPVQENEIENKELERSLEKIQQTQPQKPASPGLAPTSEPSNKTRPLPQGMPNQPKKAQTRETGGSEKGVPSGPATAGEKGQSPQQQSAPNWSPLEKQKPEQPPSPQKPPSQVTMSRGENKEASPDQGKEIKDAKEDQLPLNEEDEEMLREEREYDFDQTNNSFFNISAEA